MEGLERERKALQQLALRALGQDPHQDRLSVGQLRSAGLESDIESLPVDMSEYQPIQDGNGHFYFMVDFSGIDGADPIE